jgi:hypothetical protein
MRNYYLVALLVLVAGTASAQLNSQPIPGGIRLLPTSVIRPTTTIGPDRLSVAGECGTPSLDSATIVNQPWFGNNQFLVDFINSSDYSGPSACTTCRVTPARYRIPVKVWIYRRSDGSTQANDITPQNAEQIIRLVNDIFDNGMRDGGSTGIQFYLNCSIDFVDNTKAYEDLDNDVQENNVFQERREVGHVNVHFIRRSDNSDFAGTAARGIEPTSRRYGAIVVSHNDGGFRELQPIAITLAHELGHVFNLDHTHDPGRALWNPNNGNNGRCYQEPVSRDRRVSGDGGFCPYSWMTGNPRKCEINGDRLSDTEADPEIDGRTNNCIYSGGGNDRWGDAWNPDVRNLMSTAGGCRRWFTPMQVAVMNYHMLKFFAEYSYVFRYPEFDVYEPNNLWQNAQLIALNADQLHTFHWQPEVRVSGAAEACDEDWVRFNATTTQPIEIETKAVAGKPTPDTQITLFRNDSGTLVQVAADDDTGNGNLSRLGLTLGPGDYRLRITQKNAYPAPESRGHYFVQVGTSCYDFLNADPSITNSPNDGLVCSGGTTFSLQNAPAGVAVAWSASSGITINSTTGVATAQNGFSGQSTVTATYSRSGCGSRQESRTVSVSASEATLTSNPDFNALCPFDQVQVSVSVRGGASSYFWDVQGNFSIASGQGTSTVYVNATDGFQYGVVRVTFTNSCGQSQNTSKSFNRSSACPAGFQYTVYPNPADSYVEIAPDESVADNQAKDKDFEVVIYDNFAQEKLRAKTPKESKEKRLKLDVTSLPLGVYVVQIMYEGGVEQKQLEIMR